MSRPLAQSSVELRSDLDVERLRRDFPILTQFVHGKPLAYLDNAATTQKPLQVIESVSRYYRECNANIHRGVHTLSQRATEAFESARSKIQRFINARELREVIFVRGVTEAVNLVAQSYARPRLRPGDEILISEMEHHSNIVPWQMVCEQTGALLKVIPIDDAGELLLGRLDRLLNPRTRLLALVHVSNALGTVNPVREVIERAHALRIPVLIDGAQAVAHQPVDVQRLGCDFYTFSGHKLFGPTGIGVLYGKAELLEAMPPYQGGGEMIRRVSFKEKTTYAALPHKLEAGTPHIAGAIGLGAAVDYLNAIGIGAIGDYEQGLLRYATERAVATPGLRVIGTARDKANLLSFVMQGIHPHDIGTILDSEGIAVRTGHHCAMPVMEHFGVPATVRASFAFYNTRAEIDRLFQALDQARRLFG